MNTRATGHMHLPVRLARAKNPLIHLSKSARAKGHAGVFALAIGASIAVAPLNSRAETFDIKTGSWEVASTLAIEGMPVPKKVLDEMPPAQRAKMEQMMRARAAKSETHTVRQCLTKEDLDRSRLHKSDNPKCTSKVISQSARLLEVEETCPPPEASKTHVKYEAKSADSFVGSMDRAQGEDGKIHLDVKGRWLAAVCKKGIDE